MSLNFDDSKTSLSCHQLEDTTMASSISNYPEQRTEVDSTQPSYGDRKENDPSVVSYRDSLFLGGDYSDRFNSNQRDVDSTPTSPVVSLTRSRRAYSSSTNDSESTLESDDEEKAEEEEEMQRRLLLDTPLQVLIEIDVHIADSEDAIAPLSGVEAYTNFTKDIFHSHTPQFVDEDDELDALTVRSHSLTLLSNGSDVHATT